MATGFPQEVGILKYLDNRVAEDRQWTFSNGARYSE